MNLYVLKLPVNAKWNNHNEAITKEHSPLKQHIQNGTTALEQSKSKWKGHNYRITMEQSPSSVRTSVWKNGIIPMEQSKWKEHTGTITTGMEQSKSISIGITTTDQPQSKWNNHKIKSHINVNYCSDECLFVSRTLLGKNFLRNCYKMEGNKS